MGDTVVDIESMEDFQDVYSNLGEDGHYHPTEIKKIYGKDYRDSEVVVAMLRRQCPIVCDCGELCNFGKSGRKASIKGMSKFYVNCGHWRGKKYEPKSGDGCKFVSMVQMDEDFVWAFSPALEEVDEEIEPKDPEPEHPPKRARVSASAKSTTTCKRCGFAQGGLLVDEEQMARLTCTQRGEIEGVVKHMLESYF